MRTTLAIDNELLTKARRLSGVQEKAALVREGLRSFQSAVHAVVLPAVHES